MDFPERSGKGGPHGVIGGPGGKRMDLEKQMSMEEGTGGDTSSVSTSRGTG